MIVDVTSIIVVAIMLVQTVIQFLQYSDNKKKKKIYPHMF